MSAVIEKVFPNGTLLKIVRVDRDGMLGRDPHPQTKHVGMLGMIYGNEYWDGEKAHKNVPSDTKVEWDTQDDDFKFVVYEVQLQNGDKVQLMSYEFEEIVTIKIIGVC